MGMGYPIGNKAATMRGVKVLTGPIDDNHHLLICKSTDIGLLSHASPTLNHQAGHVDQQVFIG